MKRRRSFVFAVALPVIALFGVLAWLWLGLPDVDSLHARTRAPNSRIVDRRGELLYEIVDPRSSEAGRHQPVSLARIPQHLRAATIAVEDASFYENPGVDVVGVLRALWINLRGGEALAGGSTITQQLARTLLLDAAERQQRSLLRKVRESLLAWQLARHRTKDEVLTLYLNEIYYGNLAYGVEAAARTYFGKGVAELDLAESAFLAGLPQSPVAYDPFINFERARERQRVVLTLMERSGAITSAQLVEAQQERLHIAPRPFAIRAPHFVAYARAEVERLLGTERILGGGLTITTTLDLAWQDEAQRSVRSRLQELAPPPLVAPAREARNAAVLALEPAGGAIRVMVGSPDYFDQGIAGAVNATTALRQPGSAIKPLTYAAALASLPGFTAATPILDVRTSFPTREGSPYVPLNYDRRHHGPISVRNALATSNNVAAVQVLQQVGLQKMIALANDLGLTTFHDGRAYGLALTLGGGEVRLIDLTAAYAAFAAGGVRTAPYAIEAVSDRSGVSIYRHVQSAARQVLDRRVAWLISDILSDDAARAPAFGAHSVLSIDRPAAVKTGTTTDFRDNWTVGYTPQIAVGVWVGNADGSPMQRVSGVSGAGPIWHDVMRAVLHDTPSMAFAQPGGMVRVPVCGLSGMLPTLLCPHVRDEWFIEGSEPVLRDTWHRMEDGRITIDVPAPARSWARDAGWPLAHERPSAAAAGLAIVQPYPGTIVRIDRRLPRGVQRIPLEVRSSLDGVRALDVIDEYGNVIARFAPYGGRMFWSPVVGEHTFTARAHRIGGVEVRSAAVRLVVVDAASP